MTLLKDEAIAFDDKATEPGSYPWVAWNFRSSLYFRRCSVFSRGDQQQNLSSEAHPRADSSFSRHRSRVVEGGAETLSSLRGVVDGFCQDICFRGSGREAAKSADGSLVRRGRPLPDLSCHLRGVRLKIRGGALLLQIHLFGLPWAIDITRSACSRNPRKENVAL